MKAIDPLRVMQAHDGELAPEEEEQVLGSLDALELDRELRDIGHLVRALENRPCPVADSIADHVMARIARAPEPAPPPAPARPMPRFAGRTRGHTPWLFWGPALGAAAGIALLLGAGLGRWFGQERGPASQHEGHSPSGEAATHSGLLAVDSRAVVAAIAIESIDFGERSGTIFLVPGGDQGVTPVVWLVDEPADQGKVEQL